MLSGTLDRVGDELQDFELLDRLDAARLPVQYLASLFSVGDEQVIRRILRKMYAVRLYMRRKTVEQVCVQQGVAVDIDDLGRVGVETPDGSATAVAAGDVTHLRVQG